MSDKPSFRERMQQTFLDLTVIFDAYGINFFYFLYTMILMTLVVIILVLIALRFT